MASKKTERRKGQKAGLIKINMRGHQKGVPLSEDHKAKIQTSQILNRLNGFVLNQTKMAPHQVTAALGLLKKVLPDLSATHGTEGKKEKTFEEWVDEINRERSED